MNKKVTFRIDDQTLDDLRLIADQKGITLSKLIREILKEKTKLEE